MRAPDLAPILVATDFSTASTPAFRAAVSLAAGRRPLVLVHTLMPPSPFVTGGARGTTWERLEARARRDADRRLTRLIAAAHRRGARVSGRVLTGLPAEAIVDAARAMRASILVIGTHGRTGLARAAMGSVAARVLRSATCPVLTVRAARPLRSRAPRGRWNRHDGALARSGAGISARRRRTAASPPRRGQGT